ncbi:MAG: hypothetical protein WCO52_03165 [bacterium]
MAVAWGEGWQNARTNAGTLADRVNEYKNEFMEENVHKPKQQKRLLAQREREYKRYDLARLKELYLNGEEQPIAPEPVPASDPEPEVPAADPVAEPAIAPLVETPPAEEAPAPAIEVPAEPEMLDADAHRQLVRRLILTRFKEKLKRREELDEEDLLFIARDLVQYGWDSIAGEMYVHRLGFKNLQEACDQFGVDIESFSSQGGIDPQSEINVNLKQPSYVKRVIKDGVRTAKTTAGGLGVGMGLSALGLATISMGTAVPLAALSFAGAMAGRSIMRHFKEKKLYQEQEDGTTLGGSAFQELTENVGKATEYAQRYIHTTENPEAAPEATQEQKADLLRFVARSMRDSTDSRLKNIGEPPADEKLAKFGEFMKARKEADKQINKAGMIGGAAGSLTGGLYNIINHWHGLQNSLYGADGVRLDGMSVAHDSTRGHLTKMIQGAHDKVARFVLERKDMINVSPNTLHAIYPGNGATTDAVDAARRLGGAMYDATTGRGLQLFHNSEVGGLQIFGAFLKDSLAQTVPLTAFFGAGAAMSEGIATMGEANRTRLNAARGKSELTSLGGVGNASQVQPEGSVVPAPPATPEAATATPPASVPPAPPVPPTPPRPGGPEGPQAPVPPAPPVPPTERPPAGREAPVRPEPGLSPAERETRRVEFQELMKKPGTVFQMDTPAQGNLVMFDYVYLVSGPNNADYETDPDTAILRPLNIEGPFAGNEESVGYGGIKYEVSELEEYYIQNKLRSTKTELIIEDGGAGDDGVGSISELGSWEAYKNGLRSAAGPGAKNFRDELRNPLHRDAFRLAAETLSDWPKDEQRFLLAFTPEQSPAMVRGKMEAIWDYQGSAKRFGENAPEDFNDRFNGNVKLFMAVDDEVLSSLERQEALRQSYKALMDPATTDTRGPWRPALSLHFVPLVKNWSRYLFNEANDRSYGTEGCMPVRSFDLTIRRQGQFMQKEANNSDPVAGRTETVTTEPPAAPGDPDAGAGTEAPAAEPVGAPIEAVADEGDLEAPPVADPGTVEAAPAEEPPAVTVTPSTEESRPSSIMDSLRRLQLRLRSAAPPEAEKKYPAFSDRIKKNLEELINGGDGMPADDAALEDFFADRESVMELLNLTEGDGRKEALTRLRQLSAPTRERYKKLPDGSPLENRILLIGAAMANILNNEALQDVLLPGGSS